MYLITKEQLRGFRKLRFVYIHESWKVSQPQGRPVSEALCLRNLACAIPLLLGYFMCVDH